MIKRASLAASLYETVAWSGFLTMLSLSTVALPSVHIFGRSQNPLQGPYLELKFRWEPQAVQDIGLGIEVNLELTKPAAD